MKTITIRLLAGMTLLGLLTSLSQAAPISEGQLYRLIALGTLPDKKESFATGLSSSGQVVGYSSSGPFTEAAFRYEPNTGKLLELGQAIESSERAFGTNDLGDVVGDSTFGRATERIARSPRQAVILRRATVAALGTGGEEKQRFSRALDINNFSLAVGHISADAEAKESTAVAWSRTAGFFRLGTLGGEFSQAQAINDTGRVTGFSDTASRRASETHAFLAQVFENGKVDRMLDLGTLGGSLSFGMAISEKDHVAGYSTTNETDDRFHAFLYAEGRMHDLGSLSQVDVTSDQSFGLGVNRFGQVVGYAFIPSDKGAQQVGFVYREEKMQDLNALIGRANKNFTITSAEAINDRGMIAATAFDQADNAFRAVLLVPVEDRPLE